jgi:ABC-2 type transport system permease protein
VIGSALYLTLCGLFASGVAAIIRNTAAAITAMTGLLFVLPVLVNWLPGRAGLVRWLPTSAARALSVTVWNSGLQNSNLFSPWGEFAVFAICTAVLLVVGGIVFCRRDA